MSAKYDISRVVRSWIREEDNDSADRVLQVVLSRLDSTPQRRLVWPPRRFAQMNRLTQVAVAAAAVLVVAVVGYNFLPGNDAGRPITTPSAQPSVTPSVPVATTRPSPKPDIVPPSGALSIGSHPFNLEGIPMTFDIATTGWSSNGAFGWEKAPERDPAGAGFIVWEDDADGIFSDPCAQVEAPAVGPSAMDMAEAIAAVPGVEVVTAPRDITIDGRHAVEVAIRIPDQLPCAPGQFYLWYDETIVGNARYATDYGMTIRVWIIEENGHRVQLDGETYAGAKAGIKNEIDAIANSIKFE